MFFKVKNTAVVLTACAICAFAQSRPFPQASNNGFVGTVIKPSNRTQDQLNQDVTKIYDSYKSRFLRQAGSKYYILAKGQGDSPCSEVSISEAHGYGMIIFALMAGYDRDAKTIFDGMNELRKAQKSTGNSNLMSWVVCNASASSASPDDAATDGDLDNAYALLLAYKQWGGNYLNEAKTLINAIKSSEMHGSPYYRTNLGDWDRSANNTRSSDWMPGHFRAFREATEDAFWSQAADTVYNLLAQCSNATTGLIPDFATGAPARPDKYAGGADEEENADQYYYNACRDPWRLALAYAHHGDPKAKAQIDKISSWLRGKTNSQPQNIKAGYSLDGTKALENFDDIVFTAPFASGMIADQANQSFLNSTYDNIRTVSNSNNEYATALQLLNVLLISGNWWAPYSAGSPTPPGPTTNYNISVTYNSGGTVKNSGSIIASGSSVSVQSGNSVTLTITANSEYYISDVKVNGTSNSAAKTSGTYTFSNVTENQTINVTFTQGTPPNPPVGEKVDLVNDEWEGEFDSKSSGTVTSNNGAVDFTFNRGKEDESKNIYTDARAAVYFDAGNFTNATSITITYTADKPIKIVLIDPALDTLGAAYEYELSASTSSKTVTIDISNFTQPDWVDEEGLSASLNKSKVEGIAVAAVNDGTTTKGKITKFEVAGMSGGGDNTPIVFENSKGVKTQVAGVKIAASKSGVNFNIPGEKQVSIAISDVKGRLLLSKDIALNSGVASLNLPSSIAKNQTLILSVKGKNGLNVSQKILLK